MIKSREIADQDSCLNRALEDEPVFVLRAKDRLAADLVERWAGQAEGVHEPERVAEARLLAEAMRDWRQKSSQRTPREQLRAEAAALLFPEGVPRCETDGDPFGYNQARLDQMEQLFREDSGPRGDAEDQS